MPTCSTARPEDATLILGDALDARRCRAQCEIWPRGTRPADFHDPLQSDKPVLMLAGELDPVTPPRYGEAIVKSLPNGRLLIAKGQGHNVMARGCLPRLVGRFVETLDAKTLDAAMHRPTRPDAGVRRLQRSRAMIEASGSAQGIRHRCKAVDGVSFVARDGEITGLLGPNGAGKTTTLRMLYTLMQPDRRQRARRRHRRGRRSDRGAPPARRAARRARSVQAPDRAREHRLFRASARARRTDPRRGSADALIAALDMADIADRRTEGFSQGQRVKTAIARALVHDPRNVILDEPTNGLDVMATRAMREFMQRLKGEGRCVLFSSHIMQEVAALCDRIVVIAHGRVVADASPDALRAQTGEANLEDAFVAVIGSEEGLAA